VVRKAPVERLGARAYRAPAGAKLRGVNADHEGGSPDRHESSSDAASTRYSGAIKGYAESDRGHRSRISRRRCAAATSSSTSGGSRSSVEALLNAYRAERIEI
jgi:hypothetical protein